MKILVTGATGFVGSHVARKLQRDGHRVILLVRSTDKARQLFSRLAEPVPELVVGDVSDGAAVATALAGCEGVVHAAAGTPVNIGDTSALSKTNVEGTRQVIGRAVDAGIRHIVYVSSITAIFNTDADKVTEHSPLVPSTMAYGQSKVDAECLVRELQDRGAGIAIVYPGAIIGPDDPGLSATFKALLYRINQGFRITEGGMQHVDVRDLAAIIVALISQAETTGRHLTPGPYRSWRQWADIIEQSSGVELQRVAAKGWVLRMVGRCYDIKRKFTELDSPISAETMRYSTQWPEVKPSASLAAMGCHFRPPEETFADSLRWLAEAAYLPREQLPRLFQGGASDE